MKSLFPIILTILIALLALGCGGDSNPTNTQNIITETGSESLLVNAEVKGTDAGSGLFVTEFNVTIQDSLGAPVTNATVTISHVGMTTANLSWDNLTASLIRLQLQDTFQGFILLQLQGGLISLLMQPF